MMQRGSTVQKQQQEQQLNLIQKQSQFQNIDQQTDQLTYGTQLTYEQKENIKLLSSKFVNKYVKASKRNYSNLSWNIRVITIRDKYFQYYKLNKSYKDYKQKPTQQTGVEGEQANAQQQGHQQEDEDQNDKMEILPEEIQGLLIQKGQVLMTDIIRVQWPSDEEAEKPRQRLVLYFPKNKMTLYDNNNLKLKNEKEKGEEYWMFELGNFMRDDHRERNTCQQLIIKYLYFYHQIEREKRQEDDRKKKERKRQEEEEKKKKEQQDKKKTAEQLEEEKKKAEDEEKKKVKQEQEEKQLEEMTKRQRETSQQNQDEIKKNQEKADKASIQRDKRNLKEARKKFENSFEYYYNLLWEEQKDQSKAVNSDIASSDPQINKLNEQFELNMKLLELVGHFKRRCASIFKKIISSMTLPLSLQNYKKVESFSKYHSEWLWLKEEGEDLYVVKNIIFRIAKFHFIDNKQTEVSFNDYTLKSINNEFRANRILSDILFNLRRDFLTQFQVPLTCVVEYLGYKAICIAMPPIHSSELSHGPNYNIVNKQQQVKQIKKQNSIQTEQIQAIDVEAQKQVVYKEDPSLDADLSRIAKILNLKSFTFKSKQKLQENSKYEKKKKTENNFKDVKIHLSIFNEIYEQKDTPQWKDTIFQLQKIITLMDQLEEQRDQQDKPIVDENYSFQHIINLKAKQIEKDDPKKSETSQKKPELKPEKRIQIEDDIKWIELIERIIQNKYHKKQILNSKQKRNDQKYYYIMKNSNIFPVMFQVRSDTFDFSKQFRPEFLYAFDESKLSNGAFINPSSNNGISDDERINAELSKAVVEVMIPQLIQKLENLQTLIYDSKSISKAFHQVIQCSINFFI